MNLLFLFLLMVVTVQCTANDIEPCPCKMKDLCILNHFSTHREVTVVTENLSDFKKWKWEGIHNVINAAETDKSQLMCYAHSKKANYGILVKMPHNESISGSEFDAWMNDSVKRASKIFAEIIAVDLLDLIGNCHKEEEYGEKVTKMIAGFANRVHFFKHKLACVMPWKPPCFQSNCNVTKHLNQSCDFIWTSPESYITECDRNCRAKATMPISNLVLGTDEYLYGEEIPASKFYIGIPWHGYDYRCNNFMGYEEPVCQLPTKDNGFCDFKSSRKKMTFYDLETQYPEMYEKNYKWSKLYNSNYFVVNETSNGGVHQIWYEGDLSLYEKYKFALEMKLRGVVIWTVDDLMNYDKGDAQEWNWLMHTMMVDGNHNKGTDMSMALKAMAIGVGCFVGGAIVGAIITTVIARRQMKYMNRRYQPPFQKDEDEETANFHEDDKYL